MWVFSVVALQVWFTEKMGFDLLCGVLDTSVIQMLLQSSPFDRRPLSRAQMKAA